MSTKPPPSSSSGVDEVANLRNQNESLWKIIEKQRVIIQNLQKDVAKLTTERDNLSDKNKQFEKERNRRSRVHSMFITEDTTVNLIAGVNGLLDPSSAAQKVLVNNSPQPLQEPPANASSNPTLPKESDNLFSAAGPEQNPTLTPSQLPFTSNANDNSSDPNVNFPLPSPGPVPPPRSPYRQGTVKEHTVSQKLSPPSPPIGGVEKISLEGDLEQGQGPNVSNIPLPNPVHGAQKPPRHVPPPILLPEDSHGTNETYTTLVDPTSTARGDINSPLQERGESFSISTNNAFVSPPSSPPLGALSPLSPRTAIIDKDAQTFAMWKEAARQKPKEGQSPPPLILTQAPRVANVPNQIVSPRTAANVNVVAAPPPIATHTGPFEVSSLLDVSTTSRPPRSRESYQPPARQAPELDSTVPSSKANFMVQSQQVGAGALGLPVPGGKVGKRESFMMPMKTESTDLGLVNTGHPVRHNSNPDISAHTQLLRQQQHPQSPPPSIRSMGTATPPNDEPFAPDAMSGITVKLVGSNITTNERGKEVISFIISVGKSTEAGDDIEEGIELWRVEKLYSDFLGLDAKLKSREHRSIISKIGKLPEKALFMTHAPSKVDQRKLALEKYLQHVISLPLKDVTDLCEFLSTNVVERDTEPTMHPGHHEGYLTKRGKSFGGWKARYFVLDGPVLNYYETKDGHHLGSIRLTTAQIGRQQVQQNTETGAADAANSYRHAFLILEPKKASSTGVTRHVLCAESDADRDEWVEALIQYVGVPALEGDLTIERKDSRSREKEDRLSKLRKGDKPRKVSKGEIKPIAAAPISRMMLERGASADKLVTNMPPGTPHRSMSDPAVGTVGLAYEAMSQAPIPLNNSLPMTSLDDIPAMSSSVASNGVPAVRASLEHRTSLDQYPQGPHRLGVAAAPVAVGKRSSSIIGYSADRIVYPAAPEVTAPPVTRQSSDRGSGSVSPTHSAGGVGSRSQPQKESSKSLGLSPDDAVLQVDDADREAEKKAKASGKRITFFSRIMAYTPTASNPAASDNAVSSGPTGASAQTSSFRTFFPGHRSTDSVDRSKGLRLGSDDPATKPAKQVFGVPLEQAINVARIKEGYELPAVVYRCIEYLDAKNAALEEGIYRLSGSTAMIRGLKERFNQEGDVNLLGSGEYYDVHAIAGILKMWLRELPTSVLTRDLLMEFLHVIDLLDRRDRVNELGRLVSELPLANYTLLRALTAHLMRVVQNSDINKMTMRNVGIVFSPTLGIPAGVFNLFMTEFEYIFWTNDDGYAAPRELEGEQVGGDELGTISEEKDNDTVNESIVGNDSTTNRSSLNTVEPRSLSRTPTVRLREDSGGRNNRNSVHYIDNVPDAIAGMERSLDAPFIEFEEDEEVDDLDSQNGTEDSELDEDDVYGGQDDFTGGQENFSGGQDDFFNGHDSDDYSEYDSEDDELDEDTDAIIHGPEGVV